jgi:hypothetical protein
MKARRLFERYRDADAAIDHFSNISHLMPRLRSLDDGAHTLRGLKGSPRSFQ